MGDVTQPANPMSHSPARVLNNKSVKSTGDVKMRSKESADECVNFDTMTVREYGDFAAARNLMPSQIQVGSWPLRAASILEG